jgi:hypothetical protein
VSGTIQLTANVTNNIYRTWDETKALIAGQELCAVRLPRPCTRGRGSPRF